MCVWWKNWGWKWWGQVLWVPRCAKEERHQYCYTQEQFWFCSCVMELSIDPICWLCVGCQLPADSWAWCSSVAIMIWLSLLPFWPTVSRKHPHKIWAAYFCGTGTKWALYKEWAKCMMCERQQSMPEAPREDGCFSGGSGASGWNYHCKVIAIAGPKEIPTTSPTHFSRQGLKEPRILLIYFRLRGEFNPKRYYKGSNEIATSQGKGKRENRKIKSKNAQEKRTKKLSLLIIISVSSRRRFSLMNELSRTSLKSGLYPGSDFMWQLSYIFEMPIGY